MYRIKVFLYLTLLSINAYNQVVSLSIGSGIGTCQMKDLKSFQNTLWSELPVEAKVVSSFPVFPLYNIKVVVHTKYLEIGNAYSFTSTGSKIHYSDYSGEISILQIVNSHQASVLLYPVFSRTEKSKFLGLFKSTVVFNNYSLKQKFSVYDQAVSDQWDLKSTSLAFSLGLSYCIRMKPIEIRSEVEYLIDAKGALHLKEDRDSQLTDVDGTPVKTNWSGLRIGISIGLYL
jgi:hypothetical protein